MLGKYVSPSLYKFSEIKIVFLPQSSPGAITTVVTTIVVIADRVLF